MAKNTTNLVSVDSLVFADNVRTDKCMNLVGMVESIKRHGFKVNHPLVVSDKGNGTYLVLVGNRRGRALVWLRDHDKAAFDTAIANGKVPAIVHEGLTPEDEVLIRIDHSSDEDREPLDEWSVFQAVRQLVMIGMDGQETIAVKLGLFHTKGKNVGKPNRSIIQPRANLARLPKYVQEEMRKYCDDHSSTPLGWAKIPHLYSVYRTEQLEYPDGNGPMFSKAYAEAIAPKDSVEKVGYSLSAKDARDRAACSESRGLRSALLSATGQSNESLITVDATILAAENALTERDTLIEFLGKGEYDDILSEAIASKVEDSAAIAE